MNGLAWRAAQIPAEIERTLSDAIDENGEIVNEVALAKLESLTREKTVALTDLGSFVKEDLDVKIAHMQDMMAQLAAQLARYEKAKSVCLNVIGQLLPIGDKAETPFVKLSWRKSEAVVFEGAAELLPAKFQRVKTTVDADKKAIKAAIESGEEVSGAKIETRHSLQIK